MEIGLKGYAEIMVCPENTAASVGSGLLEVYSTPSMVGLMEKAAQESILPLLEDGQGSVGIRMEVNHLAATPVGHKVWAKSELTEIDGRILTFQIECFSDVEKIGEAVHKRCLIYNDRFMEKTKNKYK